MTPARKKLFRVALAVPVLGLAALGASPQIDAQVLSGHNSDAPVDYAADRIELQDKQNRVVLTGNVDVKQAELRLRAARRRSSACFTSTLPERTTRSCLSCSSMRSAE